MPCGEVPQHKSIILEDKRSNFRQQRTKSFKCGEFHSYIVLVPVSFPAHWIGWTGYTVPATGFLTGLRLVTFEMIQLHIACTCVLIQLCADKLGT
jgi:hypothetical protein